MKTMRVHWAEGAIEQAVARLEKIVLETDTDATHSVVGRPLSWTDLACLLDIAREREQHAAAWAQLLPILQEHPLSKDDVQDDNLHASDIAKAAAEVLVWQQTKLDEQDLPLALLRAGIRGFVDQVNAMAAELKSLRALQPPCGVCGDPGWRGTELCNLHTPSKGNVEVRRTAADGGGS